MSVRVTLAQPGVAIPGARTSCRLSVRNTGDAPDRFRCQAVGEASAWATVEPPVLALDAGEEGGAEVVLAVPRSPRVRAGAVGVDVRVTSVRDPRDWATAEALLRIAPFVELGARLEPATSHATKTAAYVVTVENRGNTTARTVVSAVAVDAGLAVTRVDPPALTVEPGRTATCFVTVRCRRRTFAAVRPPRRFRVALDGSGRPATALEGALVQEPSARGLRLPLAAAVLVLLAAALLTLAVASA